MGTIANVTPGNLSGRKVADRKIKDNKRWISEEFYQALNRHMTNEQGLNITYAQQMVQSVVDMATNPEKDDYVRLAATKFITEHLEGKAATMTEEKHDELPKLVICVPDATVGQIQTAIAEVEDVEPSEDVEVKISNPDGSEEESYIV